MLNYAFLYFPWWWVGGWLAMRNISRIEHVQLNEISSFTALQLQVKFTYLDVESNQTFL